MLKALLWSAAAAMSGAAAVFVPIDPAVLQAVGYTEGAGASSRTSNPQMPRAEARTDGAGDASRVTVPPLASPYGAVERSQADTGSSGTSRPSRLGRLAIATPPASPVKPTFAEPQPLAPVPVTVVRSLQAELRRVGCYLGRVDGDWGPASRFAMASFVKSINAALPTERPDTILLSLVRRHPGGACGNKPPKATNVITASVGAAVPTAEVRKLSSWQVRVAPSTAPAPRPARPQAAQITKPISLTSAPRIVGSSGSQRSTVPISDPFARSRSVSRPFGETRMSLGVAVPAPVEARRPVTTPGAEDPGAYRRRANQTSRAEQRRIRRASQQARRASVKRRRYYRRRANSSRNWRRQVFPTIYN